MAGEERLTWLRNEAEEALRQFLGDAGLLVPTTGQGSLLDPEEPPLRSEYRAARPERHTSRRREREPRAPSREVKPLATELPLLLSEYRAEYGPVRPERGTSRRSERELRALAKEIKLLITEDKRRGLEI